MSEKKKLDADKRLISKLFGFEPLDWARYENGNLAFLDPAGKKFVYSPAELDQMTDIYLSKQKKISKGGLNPGKKT